MATEYPAVPASVATVPMAMATMAHRRRPISVSTAASRPEPATNHGIDGGPKWLRASSIADHPPPNANMTNNAIRPSQPGSSRHAQTPPNPTRAPTAGASATV